MTQVKLGSILIEQKESVKKPDGNGLDLIGVSNKIGLRVSHAKRIDDLSRYKFIQRGWFAYNPMRVNVGSIGYAFNQEHIGIVSPDYVVFSCSDKILPEYLLYILKSDEGIEAINKNASGAVRKRLYFSDLARIEIVLPSIESQQNRLVAFRKIKELSNHSSENKLDDSLLTQLKQSILHEAIEGRLSSKWAQINSKEEPVSDILQQIKAVKHQLITEKKIKNEKPLPPILSEEIPKEFANISYWVRLSDLCSIEKGIIGIKKAIPGNYPLVVTAENRLTHNEYQFNGKSVIVPLVSSTGHGHASLKRIHYQEGKFAVGTILACIQPYSDNHINMKFLFHYLNMFKEKYFVRKMKGGANVTLKVSSIKETPIPIISFTNQCRFEELMKRCTLIESEISFREKYAQELMQTVLKEAFESEK